MNDVGCTWQELRDEFLTPEEGAVCDANVKALGKLLDALEAGTISRAEFDAAFDELEPPIEAGARRASVRRRPIRARVPRVAF